jgi:hypothetical protein
MNRFREGRETQNLTARSKLSSDLTRRAALPVSDDAPAQTTAPPHPAHRCAQLGADTLTLCT